MCSTGFNLSLILTNLFDSSNMDTSLSNVSILNTGIADILNYKIQKLPPAERKHLPSIDKLAALIWLECLKQYAWQKPSFDGYVLDKNFRLLGVYSSRNNEGNSTPTYHDLMDPFCDHYLDFSLCNDGSIERIVENVLQDVAGKRYETVRPPAENIPMLPIYSLPFFNGSSENQSVKDTAQKEKIPVDN